LDALVKEKDPVGAVSLWMVNMAGFSLGAATIGAWRFRGKLGSNNVVNSSFMTCIKGAGKNFLKAQAFPFFIIKKTKDGIYSAVYHTTDKARQPFQVARHFSHRKQMRQKFKVWFPGQGTENLFRNAHLMEHFAAKGGSLENRRLMDWWQDLKEDP